MKNADLNLAPLSKQTGVAWGFRSLILLALFLCSACASVPHQNETQQVIRIENQTLSRIRAYAAFESSSEVRVLLGTLEPNSSEFFPLPNVFKDHRAIIVMCERGRPNGLAQVNDCFRTSGVALPSLSTLLIRVREPILYSDYSVYSEDKEE